MCANACLQQLGSKILHMKSAVVLVGLLIVTCVSVSSQQDVQYFPAGTFSDSAVLDSAIVRWYSKQLNALGEPSLWAASRAAAASLASCFMAASRTMKGYIAEGLGVRQPE